VTEHVLRVVTEALFHAEHVTSDGHPSHHGAGGELAS
jgi:hypothetical protein